MTQSLPPWTGFGQRLKQLRIAKGMTQGELASACGRGKKGANNTWVSQMERLDQLPRDLMDVVSLADVLGVQVTELLLGQASQDARQDVEAVFEGRGGPGLPLSALLPLQDVGTSRPFIVWPDLIDGWPSTIQRSVVLASARVDELTPGQAGLRPTGTGRYAYTVRPRGEGHMVAHGILGVFPQPVRRVSGPSQGRKGS